MGRCLSSGSRRIVGVWAAALVSGCGCGGGGATGDVADGGPYGDASLPPAPGEPVAVDTMTPEEVRAGDLLDVRCILIDENGETTMLDEVAHEVRVSPAASVHEDEEGQLTAIRAGMVEVSCGVPSLMLVDETPTVVRIVPGDAAEARIEVDRTQVTAGENLGAACTVVDAHGNVIAGAEPTLRLEPSVDGNEVDGLDATLTRAGIYEASCDLAGTTSNSVQVQVVPSLPANLAISKVPDETVYGIGQVITISWVVTDRYGNPIPDARVSTTSAPPGSVLGTGRFRYLEEGTYTVTARVEGPTEDAVELTAETIIVVNGTGPAIRCGGSGPGAGPADGEMLDVAPGSTLPFTGSVADASGVATVTVNGQVAEVDNAGHFSVPLVTRFGVNFADVVATDGFGEENSRTCAFLVSGDWAPESGLLPDAVSLKLRQAAFDDQNRGDGLDSLNDILHTMVNSSGLRDSIHETLSADPVLKPSSCDSESCTFFGCICWLRSEVIYLDSRIGGPNTTSLTLVDDGLAARVRIEDLGIRVRVRGHVSGIPYDTRGWATFDYADIRLTLDTALSSGRPRITVRPGSVSVDVGEVSTSFSGLDGAIVNIVVSLFNGRVRDTLEAALRDWVTENFNTILDGLVGSLDISTLGTTFSVPRLDGTGTLDVSFGVGFSSLSTTAARMLFGIGSRFEAQAEVGYPTLGVPIPPGAVLRDPATPTSTAVAVHVGLVNQVLHTLWRGGLLDVTVTDQSLGGGLPEGLEAQLSGALPPVARMRDDGSVEIGIGTLGLSLVYPGLFEEPIHVVLGARASTGVTLTGSDLSFDAITVEELFFSTTDVSLDSTTRDVLEGFLRRLVQTLVDSALNDGLPALPVPSFELPATVSDFGLPAGAELGLTSPSLSGEPQHFVLRGDFGVR